MFMDNKLIVPVLNASWSNEKKDKKSIKNLLKGPVLMEKCPHGKVLFPTALKMTRGPM